MGSVRRIYVEKKEGLALEAEALKKDLAENVGITGLSGLRILNRYDMEGVEESVLRAAQYTVFAEPRCDYLYDSLPAFSGKAFAVEYLPGQYDQRADFCAQCICLITRKERPLIRTARVYLLDGNLSDEQLQSIIDYIVNPVEARLASMELPRTLTEKYPKPGSVEALRGFTALDAAGLDAVIRERALAMDAADIAFLQAYFRDEEGRDPTITELRILDTYWSDHCRHTTFLTRIDKVEMEDHAAGAAYAQYLESRRLLGRGEDKPVCLMDVATIGAKRLHAEGRLPDLDLSEEVNACSVRIKADVDGKEQDWLVMFKNETHNHPTEIEPFGGAATCLGGAIRDPLSGRAYAYQAMRITGSADPTAPMESTLRGKLWQRKITTTAAEGYSSYGNQIGLAAGLVREIYHPGYMAKRMEAGAIVAAAPAENVVRKTPVPGDLVLLVGGRTGRDGCGGATGSSKSHTEESLESCGAEVQKGNASEERKIQRLFRRPEAARLIKRCNDFGAGGVSVAIGELADGLCINLDAVTTKYEGLDGTELAISESQERMAVVVAPEHAKTFALFALEENLEASVVAEVTEEPRLVIQWRGDTIADISRAFLSSNGAPKTTRVRVLKAPPFKPALPDGETPARRLLSRLSSLNVCSQKGLGERFDSTAGAATVLMPYGGRNQLTPCQSMAAKLPVPGGRTDTCTLMSYGFSPEVSEKSPFHGAADAVVESAAKLVAAGCEPGRIWLTFQEYFERTKDDPVRWGKPFAALLGALSAQLGLGMGAIGGKDSMSGSFEELCVPPTLISFSVGVCNAGSVISPEFKRAKSRIELFIPKRNADGTPDYPSLCELFERIHRLILQGRILSCWALGTGGIAEAAVKMALGNDIGCNLVCPEETLYAYHCGGFIAECTDDAGGELIGETCAKPVFSACGARLSLAELQTAWQSTLEPVFPTRVHAPGEPVKALSYDKRAYTAPAVRAKRPRVLIPVFPGTTCEYDIARKFEAAGAECELLVIRSLTPDLLQDSLRRTAEAVRESCILVFPGGFLPGDKPEGSGRFVAAYFRNSVLREAVEELLERRDGLILGISDGFHALIKLGLLPYGRITEPDAQDPALTTNLIGRHQSRMVITRIASVKSPWLLYHQTGQLHVLPFSHGEGRLIADEATLQRLAANGQIAAQYTDHDGSPSMDIRFNPGGSMGAVEGIFSPDGRIFGKMAHSERTGDGLMLNIPGDKSQDIFRAGVDYFK